MPFSTTWDGVIAVVVATFLGAAIGAEREWRRHAGGLRSNALVAGASCIFARIAIEHGGSNPGATFGSIATGIGFIGAGVIMQHDDQVRGLETAATFWAVAAIGLAVAVDEYIQAVALTLVVFLAHVSLRSVSAWIDRHAPRGGDNPN
jgi:putative Mg2+ transporter-C (MgtC) family protein